MKAPYTEGFGLISIRKALSLIQPRPKAAKSSVISIRDEKKQQQFEAVKRWFYHDWARIEPKLRTSIVEGISVFLSLFDDNPDVKRVFCPPKATYDPAANKDGRYGCPCRRSGN